LSLNITEIWQLRRREKPKAEIAEAQRNKEHKAFKINTLCPLCQQFPQFLLWDFRANEFAHPQKPKRKLLPLCLSFVFIIN
jgi:hypothetical protein